MSRTGVLHGWNSLLALLATGVTTFFALGKFIILTGPTHPEFSAWELAVIVIYMDCITAFLLAYNLDVVYRIPRFGPSLNRLENYGRYTLRQKPYLRRLSFVGIVLFVLFPLAATGAVGGSILGRLLGMKPYRLVIAIGIGSTIGCGALAAGIEALADAVRGLRDNVWVQAGSLALIALLIAFLWRRYLEIDRKIEDGTIDLSEDGQA